MSSLALAAVSYNVDAAAKATGIGVSRIKEAMANGDLVAHYNGVRPVIRAVDLDEWIESLPTERPERAS